MHHTASLYMQIHKGICQCFPHFNKPVCCSRYLFSCKAVSFKMTNRHILLIMKNLPLIGLRAFLSEGGAGAFLVC